jgi:hypothetical protein
MDEGKGEGDKSERKKILWRRKTRSRLSSKILMI